MLICVGNTRILGKEIHAVPITTFAEEGCLVIEVKWLPESIRFNQFSLPTIVAELAIFLTSGLLSVYLWRYSQELLAAFLVGRIEWPAQALTAGGGVEQGLDAAGRPDRAGCAEPAT